MKIEINNLTKAQEIALEDMLATWTQLGRLGASRWTAFFADGDGDFGPQITIDGRKPEKTKLINTEFPDLRVGYDKKNSIWETIKIRVEPTKSNGLKETDWRMINEVYMIDFDDIAWKLRDEKK